MTQDDRLVVPVTRKIRKIASPEMIVPNQYFGPNIGVRDGIAVRDLLLLMNISDEDMRRIDEARTQNGLQPLFSDDVLWE